MLKWTFHLQNWSKTIYKNKTDGSIDLSLPFDMQVLKLYQKITTEDLVTLLEEMLLL